MHLEESIRTGQATYGHLSEELVKIFSEGVEAITAGTAMALATTYDFSLLHGVRDLGARIGAFLLTVFLIYGDITTSVFMQGYDAGIACLHSAVTLKGNH